MTDFAGGVVFVNDHTCRLLGWSREQVLGQELEMFLDEMELARERGLAEVFRASGGAGVTLLFRRGDGTSIPVNAVAVVRPSSDDSRELFLIGRSEVEFREQFNATARQAIEERQRADSLEAAHQALAEAHDELQQTKARLEQEILQRMRAESELRLAHKLEAVGQLAAGIAHEINTPLQYVGDSVMFLESSFGDMLPLLHHVRELAQDQPGTFSEVARLLEQSDIDFVLDELPAAFERTTSGLERVSEIVRAMKEFSHPGAREKSPGDLNEAIRSTVVVARNEYKYVAELQLDLGELPLVHCLLGDLKQVFLNLIVNAAHAIGAVVGQTGARGTIRIESRVIRDDAVCIRVEDSGCGIDAATCERIFDPFFTTKPVGRGTGQGLAIAHNIVVDKHGGTLSVESEPGRGSAFRIELPTFAARREAA